MDVNTKITTKTASGKTIIQSVEKRIDWCNATRSKLLESRTKYEDVVFSRLTKAKRKYAIRQQRLEFEGHIYFADIYIDRWKIIIEVDGGYHNSPSKMRSDKERDEFMYVVNGAELLSRHMRPLNELEMKYLSNPDFATYGINKRSPRIYEYNKRGCKQNSIKYLRKKKLISPDRQI